MKAISVNKKSKSTTLKMSSKTKNDSENESNTQENDLEEKINKLEISLAKIISQNEILTKRLDELESKSNSTLNNTLEISDGKNSNNDLAEWKKDIEKSIETILDKLNLDLIMEEMDELRERFEENLNNSSIIQTNVERFEKSEKIISNMIVQMNETMNQNNIWKEEFLNSLNEFNEKVIVKESIIEDFESLEKIVKKRLDNLYSEIKLLQCDFKNKLNLIDHKHTEKFNSISETNENLVSEIWKMNKKLNDEINKVEISNKALWDSITLISANI